MRSRAGNDDNPSGRRTWRKAALSALFIFALVPSASGQGAEAVTWARANNCASIRAYLAQYPSGRYVSEARAALRAKSCPDPEAEARRRAEREAAERTRLETETRDLRDRLAREEAARRAAETRAADEARKRVAAETAANAAKQKTNPPATTQTSGRRDLAQLNPQLRTVAENARTAESRAIAAGARARSAARQAEAGGQVLPQSGYGVYNGTGNFEGDRYAGQFANGRRDGAGVYTFLEGARNVSGNLRYEGEYLNGAPTGYAEIFWRNGNRYVGAVLDGKKSGPGVFIWASGSRYEGEWANDKRHGFGVFWSASGAVSQAGIWDNDAFTTPLAR